MPLILYNAQTQRFTLDLGNRPQPAVSAWVGWRRSPIGVYSAPAWPSSVLSVDLQVPGLELRWSEPAAEIRDALLRELDGARRELLGQPLPWKPGIPTNRTPRKYQQQAIAALRLMRYRALLGDEMGLGKTSTALWSVADSGSKRLLVVCPVSVKYNWAAEIEATLGDALVVVIDGTQKQRAGLLTDLDYLSKHSSKLVACIINYDLLRTLSEDQFNKLAEFVHQGFFIGDEFHYLKNHRSERSKLAKELSSEAKHVLGLTGTPVYNTIEDLYSQVEIIRPGTWRSFTDFETRHITRRTIEVAGKGNTRRKQRIFAAAKNLDQLNEVMNTLQVRRLKSDVGGLPPKVHTFPELQLDPVTKRVYSAMKDFARIELEAILKEQALFVDSEGRRKEMTVFHPRARGGVEAAMRCEQIAQGFLGGVPEPLLEQVSVDLKHAEKIPGRPREIVFPNAPKLKWLVETIETILKQGGAPLVFSRFNAPMFWLETHLQGRGVHTKFMHGALSALAKQQCIADFQGRFTNVLLCQVKMAEGWNATRSQDVIFLGRDWSPATNHQAEDRAHRIGQMGTVNVQIPIVRGTVEVMIHRKLSAKKVDAQQALRTTTVQELMEAL